MDEQRIFNILLQNATSVSTSSFKVSVLAFLNVVCQFFEVIKYLDAVASVRRLARLVDPDIAFHMLCQKVLKLLIYIQTTAEHNQMRLRHIVDRVKAFISEELLHV